VIHYLAQAAETADPGSTAWERVTIALVPVLAAIVALFNRKVRNRVDGGSEHHGNHPDHGDTARSVAQTVSTGTDLQHLMVVDLQARLDKSESRAQRLDDSLTVAENKIADLRVTVAELEAQIARMRLGWETRP
jgi:hypothetical protein